MADTKFAEPEQDGAPEDLWTLIQQLRIRDLVNAMKQITLDDIQHLTNVDRGRPLNLETFTLLCKEYSKTRTGCATLTTIAIVVCTIILVYPMVVASPFLNGLGFTDVGPATGSIAAAAQPASGVGAFFSTLQSAAMAGYGVPIVAAFVQGTVVTGIIFAAYKLWSMYKRKNA